MLPVRRGGLRQAPSHPRGLDGQLPGPGQGVHETRNGLRPRAKEHRIQVATDGALVAAPTGSGKTVVGEFAVHLALAGGRKCFYTTPIKALSNQKYHDLVARYGPDRVGLMTGDTSINSEAQIVVMIKHTYD